MTPFQLDMALQDPVFYMMRTGIRVDLEKKRERSELKHEEWEKLQKMFGEIVGYYVNTSSPKQMKELLYSEFKLPIRKKEGVITTNEEAIRASMVWAERKIKTMKTEEGRNKWFRIFLALKLMLKIRSVRKVIESYLDIELDSDGRARCQMSVGGTETGRLSHSKTLRGTGLNLATVPLSERVMYVATEGYELCELDLNRGESWVYTHLSEDPELMRIHHSGGDFHSETAAAIQSAFGSKGLTATEIARLAEQKDPFGYRIRYLGKKNNHANSYQMGPYRAAEVVNLESDETNITVTPGQMQIAQKLWLGKYFGIQPWWDWIRQELDKTRTLETPYGRKRMFFGFMSDHLQKEATAYVPQSTSVDYLNRGMLRVFRKLVEKYVCSLRLLHQNHDSILVEYPIGKRTEIVPQMIELLTCEPVIINRHKVTIPIEAACGENWLNLKTWKG